MLYAGGWKGPGEIAFSCEKIPVEAERDEEPGTEADCNEQKYYG